MPRWIPVFYSLVTVILLTHSARAQDSEVSEQIMVNEFYARVSLKKIVRDLETKYRLEIDCDRRLLDIGIMPPLSFIDNTLHEVFARLLHPEDFNFEIYGRNVIIREKGEVIKDPHERFDPSKFNFDTAGKIIDKISGETLPYASVAIKGTSRGGVSNVDGFFTLFNVPSDTSTLICRYIGYVTKEFKITPDRLENGLVIGLEPLSTELEEVIISDKKEHMIKASEKVSTISVSPQQLSALPSLGEKDIFRSLQLLPGISATNETSSGLYVRGGTPDQNLILFDGFTVYHVDHFYGFFSAFNANAIKDVQLYKGGFESKFGGRLSSVVELNGKTGNDKKVSGNAGLSAISANASLEIPFAQGDGTILLAGRRSYTDIIKSGIYQDIFDLFNEEETNNVPIGRGGPRGGTFNQTTVEPAFFFHDLNAKISFKPSKKDIISVSLYNGQDNLDQSNETNNTSIGGQFGGNGGDLQFSNSRTDITKWGNTGGSLKWGRQWSNRFYSNAVLAYSNYFSQRDLFTQTEITRQDSSFSIIRGRIEDNDLKDFTFKLDNEFLVNEKHQLAFGAQFTRNEIVYILTFNDTLNILNRNDKGTVSAFYFQDQWQPGTGLSVTAGIRASYYDVTEKAYFEPRVSASYQLSNRIKLKGAYGKYYQFAKRIIREDVTEGSRDFWLLANDGTNPVSAATHYIAGVSYEIEKFFFDIELYHKDMTGLTEYSLRFANNRRVAGEDLFFAGTGYARGIEFLAQKKFGKLTGWVSYTLGEVIYEFPDLSDEPFPAIHDQTHEFKIINSLRLGKWSLAATWVYATGKPYTAPIGGYELTLLDGTNFSYISVGEKNALRLPSYHRMDLSATYHFNLGKAKSELGLSVFNAYNRTNIWYKTFEVIEDDIITTDVTTIGFTPNIFFNINF